MASAVTRPIVEKSLRQTAEDWLSGHVPPPPMREWETGVDALSILYRLASSPTDSADALKLLHELQVHQVELALQHEALQKAHEELVTAARSANERYGLAPVGYLTVTSDCVVVELNRGAARLLGSEIPTLVGCKLDSLLTRETQGQLQGLLHHSTLSTAADPTPLQVVLKNTARTLQVLVRRSLHTQEFFIALIDIDEWSVPRKV